MKYVNIRVSWIFPYHSLLKRVRVAVFYFSIVQKSFSSKKAPPSIKHGALEEKKRHNIPKLQQNRANNNAPAHREVSDIPKQLSVAIQSEPWLITPKTGSIKILTNVCERKGLARFPRTIRFVTGQMSIKIYWKISVWRSTCCLEFSITWGRRKLSTWPFH